MTDSSRVVYLKHRQHKGRTLVEKKAVLRRSTQKAIAALILIVSAAGFAGVEFYILREYRKRRNLYIDERLASLTSRIDATVHNLDSFSRYVFETEVNLPDTTALMEAAWEAAPESRGSFRAELQALMSGPYERLLRYNFRQLHFHFPDTTSFLRMHSPAQFGDKLKDVRITVLKANRDLVPVIGFEEGRIFNGFRFVYPLFNEKRLCGSVEVSFSMTTFLEVLGGIGQCTLRFAVDRKTVETTVFEQQQSNYAVSDLSPNLMADINVPVIGMQEEIPEAIRARSEPLLALNRDFGLETVSHGIKHLFLYKSIRNVSGTPVAWIVMSLHDEGIARIRRDYIALALAAALAWLLTGLIILLVFRDRERLTVLSHTDRLTGIANRQYLYEQAPLEFSRADRHGYPVSAILFDIDHFKAFNDEYGHAEGDRVLAETAKLVSMIIRTTDIFARWGGEEFIILLSHCTKENAIRTAEKIRETIAAGEISPHKAVTVSLGVASFILGDTLDSMIGRADAAMYEAKHAGRNCVRCLPPER